MPRPAGDGAEVHGFTVWLPDTVGEAIEGWLSAPFTQPDFRGNLYLIATDDKGKLRIPAHSQLQAKLDEARVSAGRKRAWVLCTYKGTPPDSTRREYTVQLFTE